LLINVIDVGLGNVRSIEHWLDRSNLFFKRTSHAKEVDSHGPIIIPGVASAGEYMYRLRHSNLDRRIVECAQQGQKIIGICLGFQLLTNYSEEDGGVKCLGILQGSTRYINGRENHNGWEKFYFDSREIAYSPHIRNKRKKIASGRVYFNHELQVDISQKAYIKQLDNGVTSFAVQDNIFGFQFHPEKSQKTGQDLLELIV